MSQELQEKFIHPEVKELPQAMQAFMLFLEKNLTIDHCRKLRDRILHLDNSPNKLEAFNQIVNNLNSTLGLKGVSLETYSQFHDLAETVRAEINASNNPEQNQEILPEAIEITMEETGQKAISVAEFE